MDVVIGIADLLLLLLKFLLSVGLISVIIAVPVFLAILIFGWLADWGRLGNFSCILLLIYSAISVLLGANAYREVSRKDLGVILFSRGGDLLSLSGIWSIFVHLIDSAYNVAFLVGVGILQAPAFVWQDMQDRGNVSMVMALALLPVIGFVVFGRLHSALTFVLASFLGVVFGYWVFQVGASVVGGVLVVGLFLSLGGLGGVKTVRPGDRLRVEDDSSSWR